MTAGHPSLPGRLERDVAAQREALHRRVAASGLYRHEVGEFEVAVAALRELWPILAVDEDLGSLTTAESRNLVRRVRLRDGTDAVLKVIGNVREPGEGEILAAWHGAGLPCARPLTWGYVQVRAASTGAPATSTASYVVTALVAGRKLPRPRDFDDCVGQALELVDLIRPFHLADVRVSRARPWSDRLAPHLNEILPLLETHGLPEPDRWRAKLDRLSRTGRVLVHGDPAGSNVLRTDRGLVLLDPPGAVVALPEADVAQICCQVARADGVGELIPLVAERHPRLDPSAVAGFAGLNLLVWAGYVVAEHANPDVARAGATAPGSVPPPAGGDAGIEKAERYLHTARTLLDQYPPA